MIVKIGDQKYDSEKEPIMLELSLTERELIANMDQTATKYCSFPEGMSDEDVAKFMEVEIEDVFAESKEALLKDQVPGLEEQGESGEPQRSGLEDLDGETKDKTTDGNA